MYPDVATRLARQYLKDILDRTQEELCLLGGWAVYAFVNERYQQSTGQYYLGSKDIDLGFHINPSWTRKQLQISSLLRTRELLVGKFGFVKHGHFRYAKWFNLNTGNELTEFEKKNMPLYDVFTLYVDFLVDHFHTDMQTVFGFHPLDEPILEHVFGPEKKRVTANAFGASIGLPCLPVLLATKINAIPRRTEQHKRVKDVIDTFALVQFTDTAYADIRNQLRQVLNELTITESIASIKKHEFEEAGSITGINSREIEFVLKSL